MEPIIGTAEGEIDPMKIIHTSDWHLGKSFQGVSLRDSQKHFVDWFVTTAKDHQVDLVVISGDIYDRAIAPSESIELFDSTIRRLLSAGIVVAAITGNHDAPDRVSPYDRLLDHNGFYLRGGYHHAGEVITHQFPDGPLDLALIPFLDPQAAPDDYPEITATTPPDDPPPAPGAARADLDTPTDVELIARRRRRTHSSVLATALEEAKRALSSPRSLVLAHAFVSGAATSESERGLVVGGTGEVPASLFEGFSYTALGHLHRPQRVGTGPLAETVRYSGTPLAYSFSEDHEKSVVMVDMAPDGSTEIDLVPVEVGRRVQTIEGLMDELLDPQRFPEAHDKFVRAIITDRETVLDGRARLAELYPHIAEVQHMPDGVPPDLTIASVDIQQRSTIEIVREFWEESEGTPPDAAIGDILTEATEGALAQVEP